jgi:hypothetical protein
MARTRLVTRGTAIAGLFSLALGWTAHARAATDDSVGDPNGGIVVPGVDADDGAPPARPLDLSYGAGARMRWVTMPAFMLNLFTKRNVPLSSWATGVSFFRRKANFDVVGSFTYQNMSPSDGNWLGKDNNAIVDTDLVQFRGLALYALDVSFIWHQTFTDWLGMHWGAGVGLAIVAGDVLRTSNDPALCNEANAGSLSQCHPRGVTCTDASCSEQQLQGLGSGPDDANNPHRFSDGNVPPVIPVVNAVVGVDFRVPSIRGWEATIEGGFYDAFFLGGSVGYTF